MKPKERVKYIRIVEHPDGFNYVQLETSWGSRFQKRFRSIKSARKYAEKLAQQYKVKVVEYEPLPLTITERRKMWGGQLNPSRVGTAKGKSRKPRQVKILGVPVIPAIVIGGLIWYFSRNR